MRRLSKVCALALLLAFSAALGVCNVSAAPPTSTDEKRRPNVQIEKNRVIINIKPSEIKHSKQFFPLQNCAVEDGLIITLQRGKVSVNVKDRALRGVNMTPTEMVFRIGEPQCEVSVKIERYRAD